MAPQVKKIFQSSPGPICGQVNGWTGVIVVRAVAGTKKKAKKAAINKAITDGKVQLEKERKRRCNAGTCGGQGTQGGDLRPKKKLVDFHKDPDVNKWVAYAVSYWYSSRTCRGSGNKQALSVPANKHEKVGYASVGNPACRKTKVYSGCVIATAKNNINDRAIKKAKEIAVEKATKDRDAILADKNKRCPTNCRKGTTTITYNTIVGVTIRTRQIMQATGKPFVSYAQAYWIVKVSCKRGRVAWVPRRRRGGKPV